MFQRLRDARAQIRDRLSNMYTGAVTPATQPKRETATATRQHKPQRSAPTAGRSAEVGGASIRMGAAA